MAKDPLLEDLNEPQREAITHLESPLLVLAGAGSGKTRVVTRKFAYMVKKKHIPLSSIFTVTFTNKSADEMKHRISELLNTDMRNAWIGTFHSQCNKILRKEINHLGYKNDFTIYDEDDQCSLIRHILKELNIHEALFKGIACRISILKASLVTPEKVIERGDSFGFDEKLGRVYMRYQDELKKCDAVDFDDLILLTLKLFEEHPKICSKYKKLFEYVLVDEFQDTNLAQYRLLTKMTTPEGNICVVGDDDQSIYKFRGAEVVNIRNFEKDFPNHKVVKLDQNYRSTQNILDVSGNVIKCNPHRKEKNLWTNRGCGDKVNYCLFSNEEEEAKYVARTIKDYYLKGIHDYKDFAVLYRINIQARAIEDGLRGEGIPYTVVSGTSFYQRKEIKDIIAYIKVIINPDDNVSFRRIINIPNRGIGVATLTKIEQEAKKQSTSLYNIAKQMSKTNNTVLSSAKERLSAFVRLIDDLIKTNYKNTADLMKAVIEKVNYFDQLEEMRIQNVMDLVSSLENVSIQGFLDRTALISSTDCCRFDAGVSLMTLHSAKGLEFPAVFLVGLEEGILPYFKTFNEVSDLEEERRLFYVGMTRAKERLFISSASRRKLYAKVQEQEPSRFIKDIPRECCEWIEKATSTQVCSDAKTIPINKPHIPFDIGCRVKHPSWGVGVVRECTGFGEHAKVTVNFPGVGIKKLVPNIANLKKVSL
ncbi:MAG: UvrD-helicase domain-containing protein [Thermodesulfovibrionales bacterium]|nr:UvrD-helicase domain-containing protein [Thermodesulfovibrionales bacterium]